MLKTLVLEFDFFQITSQCQRILFLKEMLVRALVYSKDKQPGRLVEGWWGSRKGMYPHPPAYSLLSFRRTGFKSHRKTLTPVKPKMSPQGFVLFESTYS